MGTERIAVEAVKAVEAAGGLNAIGTGIASQVGAIGAGIASLVGAGALLRRRLSRDRTERTKDHVESTWISQLLTERDEALDEARLATAARQADATAIARLTAQNESQARDIARLQREFAAFKRMVSRVFPNTRDFLGSEFEDLQAKSI